MNSAMNRIGEFCVQKTLEHIVNNQVLVVASKGCSEMCNIIDQRNQIIAELSEQVTVLDNSQPEEKPVTSNNN